MSHFASWALLWPRHMAHHYSHMLRCKGRKFAKKPSPYERWERGDTTQIITRHNRPRQINVELTWNTVFGFSSRKLWFSKSKLNIDISKLNYFGTFHSKKKMWYFNILFLFRRKIMLKYCCVIFFFFFPCGIFSVPNEEKIACTKQQNYSKSIISVYCIQCFCCQYFSI